ncbi:DUF983 domain-containing protein [Labrys wisconsinensis]|uniref:Uncharacterized protein (DUF983 family) n=1 Tax=Labrys wisconsinensis TaxID=425677 RepID=A0ABU0J379_9HYPH|nr:DUF983 domain-containing protein [Labrys wisconsinensis]MDQ0468694.1 uncharacterized protein (DUF983 family) [Labrys wisconsinensis]
MTQAGEPERDVGLAMGRGFRCRCPRCGRGKLFRAYLKVADHCPACGEALYHHQADDAPPYFTMLIVGHVVVGGVLATEIAYHPAIWLHMIIWLPLTVILSLVLLPCIKGAIVGLQWATRMHGFAGGPDADDPRPILKA